MQDKMEVTEGQIQKGENQGEKDLMQIVMLGYQILHHLIILTFPVLK